MMLALRLGKTLAELQREMSLEELSLWKAFHDKNPIGDGRADFNAALIRFSILEAAGHKKIELKNLLPSWGVQRSHVVRRVQGERAAEQKLKSWLKALATVKKKK